MWHDDTFSQRNKATKKNRWGEGVTQNLKKGEGVSNIVGLGTLCQLWNFAKFFKNLFTEHLWATASKCRAEKLFRKSSENRRENSHDKLQSSAFSHIILQT